MKKVWDFLGSYGLAVVLLGFLFILTFVGTIEQKYIGLYEAQKMYFESLFVPPHLLKGTSLPVPLLPGVYLVMVVLFVNLIVGGIIRIRKSSATLGVIVIHIGILLMFAAAFVKMKFSTDGHLTLVEGQSSRDYVSYYEWEVAIWDAAQTRDVTEYLIPDDDFLDLEGTKKRTFESKDLPFKLELSCFVKNGTVEPKGQNWESAGPVIDGFGIASRPPAKEAENSMAVLVATVNGRSAFLSPFPYTSCPLVVDVGGKKWAIDLRHKKFPMPFKVTLKKFTHEYYPNTDVAKTYKSDVLVSTADTERPVKIEMNAPLRDGGLVVFQAGFRPLPAVMESTFAVVKNPSDMWPLISCIIIALGMVLAFAQKLMRYIEAQSAERKA